MTALAPDLQLEMTLAECAIPRAVLSAIHYIPLHVSWMHSSRQGRKEEKKEKNLNSAESNFFLPN